MATILIQLHVSFLSFLFKVSVLIYFSRVELSYQY